MKIGILQTGRTPDQMREKHGDYDDLFKRLLGGRGFEFDTYPVLDGVFPGDPHDAEGWLITGSRFGAYEDHAWIPPLEEFLRQTYAAGVPIVGICFGHQILAQALGGKVEKYAGGWSTGAVTYNAEGADQGDTVLAWHQDQITEVPSEAQVTASSPFCRYAMLSYGDKALTVQPHPEFTPEFVLDLVEARRDILPEGVAEMAVSRLDAPLTSPRIADRFEAFLKQPRNRSGQSAG